MTDERYNYSITLEWTDGRYITPPNEWDWASTSDFDPDIEVEVVRWGKNLVWTPEPGDRVQRDRHRTEPIYGTVLKPNRDTTSTHARVRWDNGRTYIEPIDVLRHYDPNKGDC